MHYKNKLFLTVYVKKKVVSSIVAKQFKNNNGNTELVDEVMK